MSRFAYLLAAEEYEDARFERTPYCHRDAQLLATTLSSCLDYPSENVLTRFLVRGDCFGPEAIIAELEGLVNRSDPDDTILFYFAGHGVLCKDTAFFLTPKSDPDNLEETGLALDAVDSVLRKDGRLCIRIIDACHSGVEPRTRDGVNGAYPGQGFIEKLKEDSPRGWVTLASCDFDEKSYWDDGLKHGAFTHAVCESIGAFPAGQPVNVLELQLQLLERMARWTSANGKTQTPTFLAALPGHQHIGVRASRLAVEVSVPEERPLMERLESVRELCPPGEGDIAAIGLKLMVSMRALASTLDCFGSELREPKSESADQLEAVLRNRIIDDIQGKQLRSRFPCNKWTQTDPDCDPGYLGSLFSPHRRPRTTTHYRFEPGDLPTLHIRLDLDAKHPIPSASLGIVAIPLQTSIYVATYTSIGSNSIVGSGKTGLSLHGYKLVVPSEIAAWDTESIIDATAQKFTERLSGVVSEIVAYLERESSA